MEEMLTLQFRGIPDYVFIVSFTILSVIIVGVFFLRKDISKTRRMVFGMILLEYVFLMFCSTVICRTSQPQVVGLELMPFWNYGKILEKPNPVIYWEVILNILLYIPIGFLLTSLLRKRLWIVLYISVLLSLTTESLQYFLHKGLCETDDVIHNTIGSLIGLVLYKFFVRFFKGGRN